jgi:hypothetical protein
MAVPETTVLEDVSNRLELLLEKARAIKSANPTDAFLPVAEFSGEDGMLPKDVGPKVHAAAVEVAARRIFQTIVVR